MGLSLDALPVFHGSQPLMPQSASTHGMVSAPSLALSRMGSGASQRRQPASFFSLVAALSAQDDVIDPCAQRLSVW